MPTVFADHNKTDADRSSSNSMASRKSFCFLLSAALLFAAAPCNAQEIVRLQGHVLDVLPYATHLARTPQSAQEPLTLTVMLNWSDPAGFDAFRQDFENPASATYRQRLSPDELKTRFGPSQEAYDTVLAWLQQNGFSLAEGSDNRLTLTVRGTRGQAESAFGVTIDDYLMGTRQFHAIDTNPGIPAALAPLIRSVSGFSNLAQPQPAGTPMSIAKAYNGALTPPGPTAGTGPGVLPPGINGAGQTIALIEYDSYFTADVSFWLSQVGLPSTLINQVTRVPVNGGTNPSGCSITKNPCGEGEVLLDIEAALGIAQGANIAVLVTPSSPDELTMANYASSYLYKSPPGNGGVISSSWYWCESEMSSSDNDSMDALLQAIYIWPDLLFYYGR
jgi:subtilase family serine protease